VPFVEAESQWSHQPQFCPGGDARPADIARILRDIGLVENDVEEGGAIANDEVLNPND
jgi:hypothetical protein